MASTNLDIDTLHTGRERNHWCTQQSSDDVLVLCYWGRPEAVVIALRCLVLVSRAEERGKLANDVGSRDENVAAVYRF